jgi:predicted  nucleic acid-binding Zn-ribbon protein
MSDLSDIYGKEYKRTTPDVINPNDINKLNKLNSEIIMLKNDVNKLNKELQNAKNDIRSILDEVRKLKRK